MILRIRKNSIIAILEYLLVITVIMGSNTMLEREQRYNITATFFYLLFVAVCLLLSFFKTKTVTKRTYIKVILATAVSILCILIPAINVLRGLAFWSAPIAMCSLFLASSKDVLGVWEKYVNVVTVLAIISLIFYVFGTVLGWIKPSGIGHFLYDGTIRNCNDYFGIYYEAQRSQIIYGPFRYRNTGLFIEAPFYNFILCMAFVAEISILRPIRKNVCVILLITILSTFSTTGLILMILVIILAILIENPDKKLQQFKLLLFPLILLIGVYVILMAFEMKFQSRSGAESYNIRIYHTMEYIKMWTRRPLFGCGYNNILDRNSRYTVSNSIGLPALLGRNGIIMFIVYLAPWAKNLYSSLRNKDSSIYFWVGSFACLFLTAVVYEPIGIFIICTQLMWSDQVDYQYG